MVFRELAPSQAHKIKSRTDLESELFGSSDDLSPGLKIRENEGEAAEHGIYYDDTEYDYMQHVRDLNAGDGNDGSFFVEAYAGNKRKGKEKMSLEDALRQSTLQDSPGASGAPSTVGSLLEDSQSSIHTSNSSAYQSQQNVPDEIAGFQPDMDPRLREALEALDDDAYVDDEEDFFGEITHDKGELTLEEFEDSLYQGFDEGDEDEGWESDVTEKAPQGHPPLNATESTSSTTFHADLHQSTTDSGIPIQPPPPASTDPATAPTPNPDWLSEYRKFQQSQQRQKQPLPTTTTSHKQTPRISSDAQSTLLSSSASTAPTLYTEGGTPIPRKKRRKGALTNPSNYSMTSSALVRTEGLTLLDARFDKMEEAYAPDDDLEDDGDDEDDDGDIPMPDDVSNGLNDNDNDDDGTASIATRTSRISKANSIRSTTSSMPPPELVRKDFMGIMDDFLEGYGGGGGVGTTGKRKNGGRRGGGGGLAELDDVRKGLGPARFVQGKSRVR